jgi:hypothetical protein
MGDESKQHENRRRFDYMMIIINLNHVCAELHFRVILVGAMLG